MELTDLSSELNELRNVIISSNLTSCYLVLQELASMKDETLLYERFRKHWMGTYKGFYDIVAQMKSRKPRR